MAAPLMRQLFLRRRSRQSQSYAVRFFAVRGSGAHGESETDQDRQTETHFGFQSVPEEEKEQKVHEVFSNVAKTYDLMNDVMSGGLHRVWKDVFMDRFSPAPGTKLLDVAGGTGDIAQRFLKYVRSPTHIDLDSDLSADIELPRDITAQVYMDPAEDTTDWSSSSSSDEEERRKNSSSRYIQRPDQNGSHVTVSDINQDMLDVGREKLLQLGYNAGISWFQGNAESLPFSDGEFDAYTIAFGIRNCTHVQQVINEAYRVLKPGGRFMCLEFSEVPNPLLRSVYDSYSFQVIPVMGQVIASDWKSYQYLVESIRRFPNQKDFANMIKAAGFRMVRYENLTFGVVAIHSGFKI
ncbi:2-methoxy-6-polyprenyl-1,4-benzoquinol methylase, mitochondrial [Aplysia californica]|uniref:2-methoxy-6-polyprenyl-1,4-benzoquinol methylase, mitochondrial n=1 Tax=Aplysia californica TaxID=6500 RepID=A0ABM0JHR3_APLCA|nr:2-methoxy-6-polyprenyl-1,4-benzoquinol methylase, mitochondrial [Aplysia californica]